MQNNSLNCCNALCSNEMKCNVKLCRGELKCSIVLAHLVMPLSNPGRSWG